MIFILMFLKYKLIFFYYWWKDITLTTSQENLNLYLNIIINLYEIIIQNFEDL